MIGHTHKQINKDYFLIYLYLKYKILSFITSSFTPSPIWPSGLRRKEAKSYGTKKMVEGVWTEGQNCVIVEDVVTTGIPTIFHFYCGHIIHL